MMQDDKLRGFNRVFNWHTEKPGHLNMGLANSMGLKPNILPASPQVEKVACPSLLNEELPRPWGHPLRVGSQGLKFQKL